jgi:succinoglycan biosynthesis protein ExoM
MLYSVCIATYKRPQLLRKLIESLINQNIRNKILLQVIVVDNDKNLSAQSILKSFTNTNKIAFEYYSQPIKNISLTRNKAVLEANGDLILFIDDDGYADNNLIISYLECMKKYQADALFGQVVPYYEVDIPAWIKNGKFFERLVQKTGEKSKFTRTGNCIVKTALLKSIDGPFDPQFGLTGGEDINMFGKLAANGANFIFCAEAIVYDYVPKERANIGWITRRNFRTGLTFTERVIKNSTHKTFRIVYEIVKGLIYILISILLMILYVPIKHKRFYWYLKFISNIGHISAVFGFKYEEYKK